MIHLPNKKYIFFLYLTLLIFCSISLSKPSAVPEVKMYWPHSENYSDDSANRCNNKFKNFLSNHFTYNIRAAHHSYNHHHSHYKNDNYNPYIAYMSVCDFQYIFGSISNKYEILSNYSLYAYPNFRSYARTLPCYKEFMLALQERIQNDKQFRAETAFIPGFEYSHNWKHEKSGFHNFIHNEANTIRNNQNNVEKRGTLNINNAQSLHALAHKYIQKIDTMPHSSNRERLQNRITTINQTRKNNGKCFNYIAQVPQLNLNDPDIKIFENSYGTHLDCQLHKELCQTRNAMRRLEHTYSHDPHVQILAPVVYRYTTQAKNEHCPLVAFELSDFCHTITQVLENGMHTLYDASSAIGKGVLKGAHDFTSIEHWKDMATGAVQLGLLFADAVGQEDALHYAMVLTATSNNSDALTAAAEQYCSHTQTQKDAINLCAQETYKKIKTMSWQEILEHGTEIGTTMILDTLALNAVNGFNRATSNLVMEQLNGALESGALLTEQYAVEVAGFGKLIVEEGAEAAKNTIEFLKKDLTILNNKNDSLIKIIEEIKEAGTVLKSIENNTWQSPGGLIYKADKKFGNRINHVLAHAKTNLIKDQHSIFNVSENKILQLIDEAWAMRGNPLESDAAAYIIDMKRIIGLEGEYAIKIVVIPGSSEILTAYPIKL